MKQFTNGVRYDTVCDYSYRQANLSYDPIRYPGAPKYYNYYYKHKEYYCYPKGSMGFSQGGINYAERFPIETTFNGSLNEDQSSVVQKICQKNTGLIVAPTGWGKSWAIAGIIHEKKVRTIVVCPKTEIAKGLLDKFNQIFGSGKASIYRHGKSNESDIVVCVGNSFNLHWSDDLQGKFGMLIIDEAHMNLVGEERIKALCFFKCGYMYGLTGTPESQQLDFSIFSDIYGDMIKAKTTVADCQVYSYLHYEFDFKTNGSWADILEDLHSRENRRNKMASIAVEMMKDRDMGIIFCDRIDMVKNLVVAINKLGLYATEYTSETKDKQKVLEQTEKRKGIIVATWSCVGVGFDYPALDTGFIYSPIKFTATTKQLVGRVLRNKEGKKKPILIDRQDSFLKGQYEQRMATYLMTYPTKPLSLNSMRYV